jgi:hypothetical protein
MTAIATPSAPNNGGEIDLLNQPVQKSMDDLLNQKPAAQVQ